jgi:hypothetical protein
MLKCTVGFSTSKTRKKDFRGVRLKRPSAEKYIKTELVLKEDFYFVFGSFSF